MKLKDFSKFFGTVQPTSNYFLKACIYNLEKQKCTYPTEMYTWPVEPLVWGGALLACLYIVQSDVPVHLTDGKFAGQGQRLS